MHQPVKFVVDKPPIDHIVIDATLEFTNMYRLRVWLGMKLIWSLARVWDCNVEIGVTDGRNND